MKTTGGSLADVCWCREAGAMVCYPIRMAALEDNDVTQQRASFLTACRHLKSFVSQRGVKLAIMRYRRIAPYFL